MEIANIRLFQAPNSSFIVYKENQPFSRWHQHPEYELVLITKGKGRRIVGDNIERFEENDLVFLGPYTPHEWLCDSKYMKNPDFFCGEGIVIQFLPDFLGKIFFEIHENHTLKEFLNKSYRGYSIQGRSKNDIMCIMHEMLNESNTERLYSLFLIFRIFATSIEINTLASNAFMATCPSNENSPMQKTLQFLMQNFHTQIQVKDMLCIANMSHTSFCAAFKYSYKMTFKDYLLNLRVGYACKILSDTTLQISEIAFNCGFENISNFNRQFKKMKGITPTKFQKQLNQRMPSQ